MCLNLLLPNDLQLKEISYFQLNVLLIKVDQRIFRIICYGQSTQKKQRSSPCLWHAYQSPL